MPTQSVLLAVNAGPETPSSAVFSPRAPATALPLQSISETCDPSAGRPDDPVSMDQEEETWEISRPVLEINTNRASFCEQHDIVLTEDTYLDEYEDAPVSATCSPTNSMISSLVPHHLIPGRQPKKQIQPTSITRPRPLLEARMRHDTLPYVGHTGFHVPGLPGDSSDFATDSTRETSTHWPSSHAGHARDVSLTPSFDHDNTAPLHPRPFGPDSELCLTPQPERMWRLSDFHVEGAVFGSVTPRQRDPAIWCAPDREPQGGPLSSHPVPSSAYASSVALRADCLVGPAAAVPWQQTAAIRRSPSSSEFPIRSLPPSAAARLAARRDRAQWRVDHIWEPLRRLRLLPGAEQERLDAQNQERLGRALRERRFGVAWHALGDLVLRRRA
ncbi:hypothetical protein MBLNU459_g8121t1 [Dothideomycetes sp. NU459]